MTTTPTVLQTVLDTEDPRALAEFYRQLLGWSYRPGDEPPEPGQDDERGRDWLVLRAPDGGHGLAFQQVDALHRTTWPEPEVPQQLHLDMGVGSAEELTRQRERVESLGGRVVVDRFDDEEEPLYAFADPSGHPFCIFVVADL